MRILIVEDDKNIANLLKTNIRAECFTVDVAHDGEKGEFMALTNEYDLVLLDNMLPKKNGMEICQGIRKKKNTPIIILSVQSEVFDKVELLNAGADDYIAKPFSFDELMARIKAVLRRPSKIEKEILKIGDIQIDLKNQTAERNKKEIYLTRKEFMLLALLAKNKGTIVSRGMIMEHVWNIDADPFSNTIETHIGTLRKKLRPNQRSKKQFIVTVPGRGYKIE